jgi:PEGA domain
VTVDGVPHGRSPMLVADLSAGDHLVVVASDFGSVKQSVTIEPGATASLMVPLSAPEGTPVSGWISVTASIDLQVFEHERLLGTSQSDRIMVAAGRHDLDLVNDTLGYRASRTVVVAVGKVMPIKVDIPKGTIALNAIPWADVWIDGESAGQTPIGNLSLSIGTHDIVFRHPDLGEQHHTALVTLKEPTRLSVDLRKK